LFRDISFESEDSSSSFCLLNSDPLSIEGFDEANKEIKYVWERSFEEFGKDIPSELTSLNKQSDWLKHYESVCKLAEENILVPLSYD
jgi:hypothetical protein